jgi:2,4-dienoyl-CoA reductase-like NADH-dependent reductase (Old Yellow Enzyme family)
VSKLNLNILFSPEKIGNVQIKNRIVRSATYTRKSEKYGIVGDKLINFYEELAVGGTGLIISEFISVDPGGTASAYQLRLDNDSFIPGQRELVKTVHNYPEVKIAAQIAHTGRQGAHPKYPPVAPSPTPDKMTGLTPRELTKAEIKDLIHKFVAAGKRAYESGYDMVQLHAAHGYFLSNFISPYTNRRSDDYGGTNENMAKILVEIFDGIKDEVGKEFPVIIKLQTNDFVPGGLEMKQGIEIAKILIDKGFEAIEPSGGIGETQIGTKNAYPSRQVKSPEEENYFLPIAKELKPYMKDCKMILMGGIKNPISAENFLKEGITDFISLSRPLIYEPDLPNRWMSGNLEPAKCISCNSCYVTIFTGPVYCVVRRRLEKRKQRKMKDKD